MAELPFVDEHARLIAAPPARAWIALVDVLARTVGGRGAAFYARAIRCEPTARAGAFPAQGSAIAGFRVARADPPRELALVGGHAFSKYALTFRLEAHEHGTMMRAETRAAFPGIAGAMYRAAVIGTGGHAMAVRQMLRGAERHAERG